MHVWWISVTTERWQATANWPTEVRTPSPGPPWAAPWTREPSQAARTVRPRDFAPSCHVAAIQAQGPGRTVLAACEGSLVHGAAQGGPGDGVRTSGGQVR